MDLTLYKALHYGQLPRLPGTTVFYDIVCKYAVHLFKRAEARGIPLPQYQYFYRAIGAWHVYAHNRQCYLRHSPTFVKGSGVVDGEIVETNWAELNRIARNTQHMTLANRAEVLDLHMNDINLRKIIN